MAEKPHKNLVVWQKAMEFIETIYRLTASFPQEERFGLMSQMRRASVSIASNIAEGAARQTAKETLQFLFIARGSVSELDTQLEVTRRLGFISTIHYRETESALNELGRLLNGLIVSKTRRVPVPDSLTHSLTHSLR
jgi:four helix bundle protein